MFIDTLQMFKDIDENAQKKEQFTCVYIYENFSGSQPMRFNHSAYVARELFPEENCVAKAKESCTRKNEVVNGNSVYSYRDQSTVLKSSSLFDPISDDDDLTKTGNSLSNINKGLCNGENIPNSNNNVCSNVDNKIQMCSNQNEGIELSSNVNETIAMSSNVNEKINTIERSISPGLLAVIQNMIDAGEFSDDEHCLPEDPILHRGEGFNKF
jgi:hypothetical protein